ncbi:MAG: hypothetical protein IJJ00_08535 [Erysipelotrichaceae bacterium]|nr:hypothetical protein [Erysipelotrichaceae bacterium]
MLVKDEIGNYHWIHEMDMKQNKSILWLILKIVIGSLAGIFAIVIAICMKDGMAFAEIMDMAWIILLCFALIIAICFFAYWLVTKMYGGTYVMIYDMNDEGISFSQTADQAEKTRIIAGFSSLAGAAAKNYGLMASGFAVANNTNNYSQFSKVRKVIVKRDENHIDLCSPFLLNMIYVDDEDFDFVENYITQRCENARIKR